MSAADLPAGSSELLTGRVPARAGACASVILETCFTIASSAGLFWWLSGIRLLCRAARLEFGFGPGPRVSSMTSRPDAARELVDRSGRPAENAVHRHSHGRRFAVHGAPAADHQVGIPDDVHAVFHAGRDHDFAGSNFRGPRGAQFAFLVLIPRQEQNARSVHVANFFQRGGQQALGFRHCGSAPRWPAAAR